MSHSGASCGLSKFLAAGVLVLGLCLPILLPASASAQFGLNDFQVGFTNEDGTPATQAGSHPFAMTTSFKFNTRLDPSLGLIPDQEAKVIRLRLPTGMAGDPTATPRCSAEAFSEVDPANHTACSDASAIGVAKVLLSGAPGSTPEAVPLYNLVPPRGVTAKVGFVIRKVPTIIDLGVNDEFPNNINAAVINVPQVLSIYGSAVEVWGNPSATVHDPFRGHCLAPAVDPSGELNSLGECKGPSSALPFLTLPRSCSEPLVTTYEAVSWQEPSAPAATGASEVLAMSGCAGLKFGPKIGAATSTPAAESPSGLTFDLNIDDPRLKEPLGNADSDIEKAVVTLPNGITTNPAVANGLQACSLAQYRSETVDSDPGTGCPEASKVGTVEVETPLLETGGEIGEGLKVLSGSIYVAKQHDNVFDNLLTIYMVIKDPELGILIKQAGRVDPDPVSGQLTTTFDHLPPLPFSHFRLQLRKGSRAPLITPPTCGQYSTVAMLYPYDHDLPPVQESASFEINSGAGGGNCAQNLGDLPNSPAFSAGTISPTAGAYSPFVLNLSRNDGSQQLSRIETTLPQGLLGKLAGIPYCPESGIAQAAQRTGEGEGAIEVAQPSCPAASQVGTVIGGAGAGPEPFYLTTGHAYLAGPYKGAPLSLEIIAPAIAGPFDLGVVAVRTALQIDPLTAQVTAVSDPIPTILHGLPLDVRSIAINMDRPQFILNPTSCEPKQIVGFAISPLGSAGALSQYFQVSGCSHLKYKPKLTLSLRGRTTRSGHPALRATLTIPKKGSYANTARIQVGLPHSAFLDQGNLDKVCTQPQLKSATCPKRSVYGHIKVWTPLVAEPLQGNVYVGVGFGHKLPDLVTELNGQIRILVHGRIDTTKHEGIRNTFEFVPDAPYTKVVLELKGGKRYGLLENSENICSKPQFASARFAAQNGKVEQFRPRIGNSCGKGSGAGKRKHGKHQKGGKHRK